MVVKEEWVESVDISRNWRKGVPGSQIVVVTGRWSNQKERGTRSRTVKE